MFVYNHDKDNKNCKLILSSWHFSLNYITFCAQCNPLDLIDNFNQIGMESLEFGRKLKRNCDNIVSKKRLALAVVICLVTIIYIIPYVIEWYRSPDYHIDIIDECLKDRLTPYVNQREEFNAYISQLHSTSERKKNYIGYSGNGYFGINVANEDEFYILKGRNLNAASGIYPILKLENDLGVYRSAFVNNYLTGVVHVFRCYQNGFYASFQYYTHRRVNSLFVQEVKFSNPSDHNVDVIFEPRSLSSLHGASSRVVNIDEIEVKTYNVTSGFIVDRTLPEQGIPISIVQRNAPVVLSVEARSSKSIVHYTGMCYGKRRKMTDINFRNSFEKTAIDSVSRAAGDLPAIKEQHVQAWRNLWTTGYSIETSKAKEALNGDTINATMYYVLSQVKDLSDYSDIVGTLSYAEGCYGNHHTLEAPNLWNQLDSVEDINRVVSYWLLTLEKNGCHKMVNIGARGVAEAMVLSYGGLRFSNQHLEFNIDPKYLHRGSQFHRIAYGNKTHVNITVAVQEDNKAVLRVVLDRSDKNYYACDAGCLDPPVLLGQQPAAFPVKLTEPLTPILYITYDRQHMEELRKAIHVREIGVAPAHEHHVIALHKHGHNLGGLPTFFWVSVSVLILIFHLFLFKLIYNEYCASNAYDKQRFRYGKL